MKRPRAKHMPQNQTSELQYVKTRRAISIVTSNMVNRRREISFLTSNLPNTRRKIILMASNLIKQNCKIAIMTSNMSWTRHTMPRLTPTCKTKHHKTILLPSNIPNICRKITLLSPLTVSRTLRKNVHLALDMSTTHHTNALLTSNIWTTNRKTCLASNMSKTCCKW